MNMPKRGWTVNAQSGRVAPHAGAWIETEIGEVP